MSMNMVQLNDNAFIVQSHVGQVIMSTTLDTEAKVKQYYGGTSWTKIEGRFLLGASSSYAVKGTGGSGSHQHKYGILTGGYFGGTVFSENSITGLLNYSDASNYSVSSYEIVSNTDVSMNANIATASKTTASNIERRVANTSTANNMPPYYAVYIWVRTA